LRQCGVWLFGIVSIEQLPDLQEQRRKLLSQSPPPEWLLREEAMMNRLWGSLFVLWSVPVWAVLSVKQLSETLLAVPLVHGLDPQSALQLGNPRV
jgi:hypothetical protein